MINVSEIQIPYAELLLRLGFSKSRTKLDEKTDNLIKDNLNIAQKLIKPKVVLAFENISVVGNTVSFENGYTIESKDIATLLKDCFKAYGIAITIGQALENKRNDAISKKETFIGLILDAAGSVAAEETIKSAYSQIKAIEEQSKNQITKRFSPGYGDWQLKNQSPFLNWLGASNIGINLNSSYLMTPEKSVSAIVGVKKQTNDAP